MLCRAVLPQVTAADYAAAKPDPVAAFAPPVCGHMNADHVSDLLAMVAHYVGLEVADAKMLALDRLGMDMAVTRADGSAFKLRLPFVRCVRVCCRTAAHGNARAVVRTQHAADAIACGARVLAARRPAEDRKGVKEVLVEMTKASRGAGGGGAKAQQ